MVSLRHHLKEHPAQFVLLVVLVLVIVYLLWTIWAPA